MVARVFEGALDRFEVSARELVWEAEEGLFLVDVVSRNMWTW